MLLYLFCVITGIILYAVLTAFIEQRKYNKSRGN